MVLTVMAYDFLPSIAQDSIVLVIGIFMFMLVCLPLMFDGRRNWLIALVLQIPITVMALLPLLMNELTLGRFDWWNEAQQWIGRGFFILITLSHMIAALIIWVEVC